MRVADILRIIRCQALILALTMIIVQPIDTTLAEKADTRTSTRAKAMEITQQGTGWQGKDDQKALHHFQRATEHDPQYPVAWHYLAETQAKLGRLDQARVNADRAVKLARSSGKLKELAFVLSGQRNILRQLQHYDQAIAAGLEVLALQEKLGNHSRITWASYRLGELYSKQENYLQAEKLFEKALVFGTGGKDSPSKGSVLWLLGGVQQRSGKTDDAISSFQRALRAYEKQRVRAAYPFLTSQLGKLFQQKGENAAAALYFQRAARELVKQRDRYLAARRFLDLGDVLRPTDDAGALSAYQQALNLFVDGFDEDEDNDKKRGKTKPTQTGRKQIKPTEQDWQRALKAIEFVRPHRENADNRARLAKTYFQQGIVLQRLQEDQQALAFLQRSVSIRRDLTPAPRMEVRRTLIALAQSHRALKQYEIAAAHLERALEISGQAEEPVSLTAKATLAQVYAEQGRYTQAEKLFRETIEKVKQAGDEKMVAALSTELGQLYFDMKKYDLADELQTASLTIHQFLDQPQLAAYAMFRLGQTKFRLKQFRQAEHYLRKVEKHATETRREDLLLGVLLELSPVLSAQGRLAEAAKIMERVLPVFERIEGLKSELPWVLSRLASIYHQQNRFGEAMELNRRALKLARDAEHGGHEFHALTGLAWGNAATGNLATAVELAQQAVENAESRNDQDKKYTALVSLAVWLRMQGKYAEAENLHLQALAHSEETGNQDRLADNRRQLALLYMGMERLTEAEKLLRQSLAHYENTEITAQAISTFATMGTLQHRKGDQKQAAQWAGKSLTHYQDRGNQRGAAGQLLMLARIDRIQGRLDRAAARARNASDIYARFKIPSGTAEAWLERGLIANAEGQVEAACRHWEKALSGFRRIGMTARLSETEKHMAEADCATVLQ